MSLLNANCASFILTILFLFKFYFKNIDRENRKRVKFKNNLFDKWKAVFI